VRQTNQLRNDGRGRALGKAQRITFAKPISDDLIRTIPVQVRFGYGN